MENNLPQKYNEGIFSKIRNFFLKLFKKKSNIVDNQPIIQPKEINKNPISMLRKENENNKEKEQLLNQIEENTELINSWSIERLLKLEKIYDEKITKYDNEIAKIKGQSV